MKTAIQIRYSCNLCGLYRVALTIPERGESEISDYMENTVITAIAHDHRNRSPLCSAKEISEVLIPANGQIGQGELPPSARGKVS